MDVELTKIDLSRSNHRYLTNDDYCYALMKYTARGGYQYSEPNQLIFNFKKPLSQQGQFHKKKAINDVADMLLSSLNRKWAQEITWTPIPPSQAKDHPEYDDRLLQVLRRLASELALDIRELIWQKESVQPAHLSALRPSPDEIAANYSIDESLTDPMPRKIALLDDVITTGAHFKAAQKALKRRFPEMTIGGIFIARSERLLHRASIA